MKEERLEHPNICRGCGAPLVWARNEEGAWIPLDPKPAIYRLMAKTDLFGGHEVLAERQLSAKGHTVGGFAVTHFATCPKASDFSRGNRT